MSSVAGRPLRFLMGIIILMIVLMKIILFFQVKGNINVRPMSRKVTVMNEVNNLRASVNFGHLDMFALNLGISLGFKEMFRFPQCSLVQLLIAD